MRDKQDCDAGNAPASEHYTWAKQRRGDIQNADTRWVNLMVGARLHKTVENKPLFPHAWIIHVRISRITDIGRQKNI